MVSDRAVVVMIRAYDRSDTDDVESSANVECNFQRLFPSMHEQAANACADSLSCHHKLPSFPFLACQSRNVLRVNTRFRALMTRGALLGKFPAPETYFLLTRVEGVH